MIKPHMQTYFQAFENYYHKYHNGDEYQLQLTPFIKKFEIEFDKTWVEYIPAKYYCPVSISEADNSYIPSSAFPTNLTKFAPAWFTDILEGVTIRGLSNESIECIMKGYGLVNGQTCLYAKREGIIHVSKPISESEAFSSEMLFRNANVTPTKIIASYPDLTIFDYLKRLGSSSEVNEVIQYFEQPENKATRIQFEQSAYVVAPNMGAYFGMSILENARERWKEMTGNRELWRDLGMDELIMLRDNNILFVAVNEYTLSKPLAFCIIRACPRDFAKVKLTQGYHPPHSW